LQTIVFLFHVSQSGSFALKPIIFILGLSSVGKTHTAKAISKDYSLLHIDIDRKGGGFAKAGFPPKWDEDVARVNFAILSAGVRGCLRDQHQGAVLSIPTTYRFRREQLGVASTHGVGVVVLWGTLERCWDVRRERQEKNKRTTPDHTDYLRKNRPTFEMYEGTEYHEFKAEAFQPDGSRPSREILLALALERLANQGIELTASRACGTRQTYDGTRNG
jgi:hypothetical protein